MQIKLFATFRVLIIYIVLFAVVVIFNLILFTRRPELSSWLIGATASCALYPLISLTMRKATIFDALVFKLLLGISIPLFIFSVVTQSPLALLNSYPAPLTAVPIVWFICASLGLICYYLLKFGRDKVENQPCLSKAHVATTLTGSVVLSVLMVVFFSSYASINARDIIGSPVCIMETDRATSDFKYWFSPRKMLFENEYKGSTSAYLRAGTDSDGMTHHWSFRAFSFVESDSSAFSGNLTFYPSTKSQRRC